MHRSVLTLSPVLAVLAACGARSDGTDGTDGSATQSSDSVTDSADTGSGSDTGDGTGTGDTTGPDCAEDACMASSEDYCYPCNPASPDPEPWLTLGGSSGFADGGTMAIVCGGQGSWMFEIRPAFGGFTLDSHTVSLAYEVRVEDFNINGGVFASGSKQIPMLCCDTSYPYDYESGLYACNQGYVGACYSYSGGLRAIRFFPPDTIPELTDLDGKAVELDVTLYAGAKGPQEFHFAGTVSATEPWDACTYYDPVPDPGLSAEEDPEPFDWMAEGRIPS